MKLTLTALTLAATLFAASASAFDPDDVQKLKDIYECKSCGLSGANLKVTDLEGAILCGTTMPDGSVNNYGY